jgi:hypothetical protein
LKLCTCKDRLLDHFHIAWILSCIWDDSSSHVAQLRTRCLGFYRHTKSEAGPRLLFAPSPGSKAPALYVGQPLPVLNQEAKGSLSDSSSNSYISDDGDDDD